MKAFLAILFLSFLTACAGSPGSGSSTQAGACSGSGFDRSWIAPSNGDQLRLTGSCTGTSSSCNSVFTYTMPEGSSPFITLTIQSTSGAPGCLPVGPKVCSVSLDGTKTTMLLNCGADVTYHAN